MFNLRINLLAGILLCVFLVLQYRLWSESGGLKDMFKLKKILAVQVKDNEQIKKRNDELTLQIKDLKESQDGVESRARSELGMVKKDETFYQIVRDPQS